MELDNPTEAERFELELLKNSKDFCDKIMAYFKVISKEEGATLAQGLWVNSRIRAIDIVNDGVPMTIDLMNLVISGDMELAYVALMSMEPDDGTETYHWLTSDRISFITNEIAIFMGWV